MSPIVAKYIIAQLEMFGYLATISEKGDKGRCINIYWSTAGDIKMNEFFSVDELHEMQRVLLNEETNKHLTSIFEELQGLLREFNFYPQYLIYECESWTSINNQILLKVKCELENRGYFVEMKKSSNNNYYLLISW